MTDQAMLNALDEAALVVMAGSFIWLVKVVVNDMKHDLSDMRATLLRIEEGLKRRK